MYEQLAKSIGEKFLLENLNFVNSLFLKKLRKKNRTLLLEVMYTLQCIYRKGVLRSYSTDVYKGALCNLHLRAGGLVIFLVFLLGSTSTYNIGGY
jgi:hypothetical protein